LGDAFCERTIFVPERNNDRFVSFSSICEMAVTGNQAQKYSERLRSINPELSLSRLNPKVVARLKFA
jgi:hypothetical protein